MGATNTPRKAKKDSDESVRVQGFYRVHITEEDGSVVGDSGWIENQITQMGFWSYLGGALAAVAGSSQVGFLALGTGSVPSTSDTILNGEITGNTKRQAVTTALSSTAAHVSAVFTGTFNSANSFLTLATNISNIGLYAGSSGSNLFAGNTYTSSACATNQNVNCTYTIGFS